MFIRDLVLVVVCTFHLYIIDFAFETTFILRERQCKVRGPPEQAMGDPQVLAYHCAIGPTESQQSG